jgi:hypothetical protein
MTFPKDGSPRLVRPGVLIPSHGSGGAGPLKVGTKQFT